MAIKKIAHRGNYAGAQPGRENTIEYIKEALDLGYCVEVDVQVSEDGLCFGHDEPQELVDWHIIGNPRVICHAKTPDALRVLHIMGAHCFAHDVDYATHTSQGYIWCYPGVHIEHRKAIWLDLHNKSLPEDTSGIFGICSDDFTKY